MPDAGVLEIETRIAPKDNTELSGLYTSSGSYFTQCEAEGFRRITYFPDRPDVMSRYTTHDHRRQGGVPGDAVERQSRRRSRTLGDGRHRVTWTDPHPKPCYLFALVAGDLVAVKDSFTTRSGRQVDLGIWVRRGDEDRCAHAMRSLKTSMTVGRGRVRPGIRPRRVQHRRRVRLQHGRDGEQGAERLQHEIRAGRSRRPRPTATTRASRRSSRTNISTTGPATASPAATGSSLSLKEGLTVYRDQEFSADQGSRAVKRIGDVRALRAAQFREDARTAGASGAARPATSRSTISIPRRSTTRAPRSSA